jgi:hypothetical protein
LPDRGGLEFLHPLGIVPEIRLERASENCTYRKLDQNQTPNLRRFGYSFDVWWSKRK